MDQGKGMSVGIVAEIQGIAALGHAGQVAAVIDITVGVRAVGALCAHAVGIVGIGPGSRAVGYACHLSAMLPDLGAGDKGNAPFFPLSETKDLQLDQLSA